MAFYLGGKEIIIQEVPVLPEGVTDSTYLKLDMLDEEKNEWWELHKWQEALYKCKDEKKYQ